MRAAFKKISHLKNMSRFAETRAVAVPSHSTKRFFIILGNDLTKKWIQRIQNKVKDGSSVEAYSKISALIDYYNKPASPFKEDVDWDYWKNNIRTEGVVGRIREKVDEYKTTQNYNIDSIAQRSVINSEKYDTYKSMYLEWNYNIWMQNYLDNIHTLFDAEALGDVTYVGANEFMHYCPGGRELMAGWRETGNLIRIPHYFEDSLSTIIRRQFRYSNRSWMPYWHPVCAWERGIQIKHVLMSL